jgi:N-acetylmuramoyl-L-alanine amidase
MTTPTSSSKSTTMLAEALLWLSLNIYHEARSEDQICQIAIGHVVLNRSWKKQLPINKVIMEPYQFSWTWQKKDWEPHDEKAYDEAQDSARIAWEGLDFTLGATNYHHVSVVPSWSKSDDMTYVGTYDHHAFYREED